MCINFYCYCEFAVCMKRKLLLPLLHPWHIFIDIIYIHRINKTLLKWMPFHCFIYCFNFFFVFKQMKQNWISFSDCCWTSHSNVCDFYRFHTYRLERKQYWYFSSNMYLHISCFCWIHHVFVYIMKLWVHQKWKMNILTKYYTIFVFRTI